MKPDHKEILTSEIDRAHAFAESSQAELAVKSFDLARAMAVNWADPGALQNAIATEKKHLSNERRIYRDQLTEKTQIATRGRLLVLGDSLCLPRPEAKSTPFKGAEITYPWLMGDGADNFAVTQIAQRYFTTADAVAMLSEEMTLAATDAAVIHLGLNDCANRIFLEDERLSLSLLDEALRTRIVSFAQKFRRLILQQLASRHYVPIVEYRRNLDLLIHYLRRGGAKKIVLTTIILPPSRAWPSTPGVNNNFASYCAAIMQAANGDDVILLELDRLIYEAGYDDRLEKDGMHLSAKGHSMFAQELRKLLR